MINDAFQVRMAIRSTVTPSPPLYCDLHLAFPLEEQLMYMRMEAHLKLDQLLDAYANQVRQYRGEPHDTQRETT